MFHFGHSHHYEPGIRGQNISESSGLWFLSSAGHFCVLNIIYFSFKTSDPQVRSLDGTLELTRRVKWWAENKKIQHVDLKNNLNVIVIKLTHFAFVLQLLDLCTICTSLLLTQIKQGDHKVRLVQITQQTVYFYRVARVAIWSASIQTISTSLYFWLFMTQRCKNNLKSLSPFRGSNFYLCFTLPCLPPNRYLQGS